MYISTPPFRLKLHEIHYNPLTFCLDFDAFDEEKKDFLAGIMLIPCYCPSGFLSSKNNHHLYIFKVLTNY